MLYIGLIRAINVGGHKPVSMATLSDFVRELGFLNVRTLLQTGNLVFESGRKATSQMERTLEVEAAKRLGLQTDFFVRHAAEWSALVAANPFPAEAKRDPGRLVLMVLRDAPAETNVAALREANAGPEAFRVIGKAAYIVYPNGQGRSRFTGSLIEKKLETRGTARNWNTVLKLHQLTPA